MVLLGSSLRAFCVGSDVSTLLDSREFTDTLPLGGTAAGTHGSSCSLYLGRAGNGWWWVPLVAPLVGGPLGAGVYRTMVEMHHPPESRESEELTKEESVPLGKRENTCTNTGAADSH